MPFTRATMGVRAAPPWRGDPLPPIERAQAPCSASPVHGRWDGRGPSHFSGQGDNGSDAADAASDACGDPGTHAWLTPRHPLRHTPRQLDAVGTAAEKRSLGMVELRGRALEGEAHA